MSPRKQLARALEEQRLVRVVRRRRFAPCDGYVVSVSRSWSAIRVVTAGRPDGLMLFRTSDVHYLGKPASKRGPSQDAMEQAGLWPPTLPTLLDLYDVRAALFTAGSLAPVLAVSREPRRVSVGNIHRITDKRLQFQPLGADGQWTGQLSSWRLRSVTRIDLGSGALATQLAAAGLAPSTSATAVTTGAGEAADAATSLIHIEGEP